MSNGTFPLLSPGEGTGGDVFQRTLILGYGNPDREDDGVAWHLLNQIARRLDTASDGMGDEEFRSFNGRPDLWFALQLTPEMAEDIAGYERVMFIDAHTGSEPEDISWSEIKAEFQASPFTHHMTAATCLSIVENLYRKQPEAVLVAIRGYQFGFSRQLSNATEQLAKQAEEQIWSWLEM